MPFVIRDFQPSDFEALWRIDQACFAPGISYSRAELKLYMRRPGAFTLVADASTGEAREAQVSKSQVSKSKDVAASSIGIGGFLVAEAARRSGHIITIDVVAAARRSGVGSLMLRAAEERLRAARCRSVELETAVDNISALSFYKRHGYHVVRTYPRYYSNGVDALILEKELMEK